MNEPPSASREYRSCTTRNAASCSTVSRSSPACTAARVGTAPRSATRRRCRAVEPASAVRTASGVRSVSSCQPARGRSSGRVDSTTVSSGTVTRSSSSGWSVTTTVPGGKNGSSGRTARAALSRSRGTNLLTSAGVSGST